MRKFEQLPEYGVPQNEPQKPRSSIAALYVKTDPTKFESSY